MKRVWFSVIVMFCSGVAWSQESRERRFTDEEWREDIAEYIDFLKATHIDLFHSVSEDEFEMALASLVESVPESSDYDLAMEMSALAALIGDGHTWTRFGEGINPASLPLRLYQYDDGICVISTVAGFEEHLGKKVVSIQGVPIEELLGRTERYTSRDNEWGLLNNRLGWLVNEAFLVHEKLVTPGKPVILQFSLADEGVEEVDFDFLSWSETVKAFENMSTAGAENLPLYRQRGDESFWMEYLPTDKTLFVKFNVVGDIDGGLRLGQFARTISDFVKDNKVNKLVIDVRHNGGGNGSLTTSFIRQIAKMDEINQRGKLFVITGRVTFSAALMFTARMERGTNALFVGEPGAGKPNSYGEYNPFRLTHTGLYGSVSSRWHEEGEPDDDREFIPVDISVPLRSTDFVNGHDPVLEAILIYDN
jgi:hypothetical protein